MIILLILIIAVTCLSSTSYIYTSNYYSYFIYRDTKEVSSFAIFKQRVSRRLYVRKYESNNSQRNVDMGASFSHSQGPGDLS